VIRIERTPEPETSRWQGQDVAQAVVAAGLQWRSGLIPMPGWLSNNGGDALWALVVFVGFGFLFPRVTTLGVALLAITAPAASLAQGLSLTSPSGQVVSDLSVNGQKHIENHHLPERVFPSDGPLPRNPLGLAPCRQQDRIYPGRAGL
jgi:hypothetical protein